MKHDSILLSETNKCITGSLVIGYRPNIILRNFVPVYLFFRKRKKKAIKFEIQTVCHMNTEFQVSMEDFKRKYPRIHTALEKELMLVYLREEIK